jgi:hypothetical protein
MNYIYMDFFVNIKVAWERANLGNFGALSRTNTNADVLQESQDEASKQRQKRANAEWISSFIIDTVKTFPSNVKIRYLYDMKVLEAVFEHIELSRTNIFYRATRSIISLL